MEIPDVIGNSIVSYNLKRVIRQVAAKLIDNAAIDPLITNPSDLISILHQIALYATTYDGYGFDWLITQYKRGNFKIVDGPDFKEVLDQYFTLFVSKAHKSIFECKTIFEVKDRISEKLNNISLNEYIRNIKENEVIKIIDNDGIKILIPKTLEAAKIYGKGTKWCVAGEYYNSFYEYANAGTIYYILCNDEKFCLHLNKHNFMNSSNIPLSSYEVKFLNEKQGFKEFLRALDQNLEYLNYLRNELKFSW
jgi:hypothetical protein